MQDATHMNYIVMPVFQFCRIYREGKENCSDGANCDNRLVSAYSFIHSFPCNCACNMTIGRSYAVTNQYVIISPYNN